MPSARDEEARYSPRRTRCRLPRAASGPAKKRRLSAENGISSPAIAVGLPTFCVSSAESSSALSSIASASFSSSSMRSFGVLNCHSDHAFLAASTAFSTSSAVPRGTSAIASPVAGFRTSIVLPLDDATHSPMNCRRLPTRSQEPPVGDGFEVSASRSGPLLVLDVRRTRTDPILGEVEHFRLQLAARRARARPVDAVDEFRRCSSSTDRCDLGSTQPR